MTIGIIGAMDEEISIYLKSLHNSKKTSYKTFTFYQGTLHHKNVIIVKSGVGKVFAAMISQYLIDKFQVSTILLSGVGGSLNKNLNIGDVIIGKDSVHHDFDAIALGFQRGQISYTNYRFFNADKTLLTIALTTKLHKHKIIAGRILTGDQFFTQREKKKHKYLTEELQGDCIEMEGATVAQVCTINNIPHLIIRTISDQANGTAVKDYNAFKHIAAENSFKIVENIIQKY